MRRLLVKIGAWLAILLGLAMMLQPTAADWLTRQRNSKTAQQFAANAASAADAATPDSASHAAAEPARAYPELYAAMQAYNAADFRRRPKRPDRRLRLREPAAGSDRLRL